MAAARAARGQAWAAIACVGVFVELAHNSRCRFLLEREQQAEVKKKNLLSSKNGLSIATFNFFLNKYPLVCQHISL